MMRQPFVPTAGRVGAVSEPCAGKRRLGDSVRHEPALHHNLARVVCDWGWPAGESGVTVFI